MADAHKNQHWLPQGYLSPWLDPDPGRQNPRRIHRYRKDGSYMDYRPLGRVFSEDDLYTVIGPDGSRDLGTEHALQALEDSYARIRDHVLAHRKPIGADVRSDLMLFIGALRERSPAMRDHHARNDAAVLRVGDDAKASLQAMTPEQRRRIPPSLASAGGPPGTPLEDYRAMAARPFGLAMPPRADTLASMLDQMHLKILLAPSFCESLVTSDALVVWWDPTDPPPSRRPLGLGRRNIEVTVPVTPAMCAMITHTPGPDYVEISNEDVDELNLRTLYRCRGAFLSEKPHLTVDWLEPSP